MPFSIDKPAGQTNSQAVEGAITIRHARAWISGPRLWKTTCPSGVDTGELEDIDTCILQLLCSLRRSIPALVLR